jgi:glyceraldehyde-3-phosphate dehydrogenase/erythrose-4-phosphate dehydrogenase
LGGVLERANKIGVDVKTILLSVDFKLIGILTRVPTIFGTSTQIFPKYTSKTQKYELLRISYRVCSMPQIPSLGSSQEVSQYHIRTKDLDPGPFFLTFPF